MHYGGMDPAQVIRTNAWGKPELPGCFVGCNSSHSANQGCVYDQQRRLGVATQFLAGRANLIFLMPAPVRSCRAGRARPTWESLSATSSTGSRCAADTAPRRTLRTSPRGRLGALPHALQQRQDLFKLLVTDIARLGLSHPLTASWEDREHVLRCAADEHRGKLYWMERRRGTIKSPH